MKRGIQLVLASLIIFGLCGCGGDKQRMAKSPNLVPGKPIARTMPFSAGPDGIISDPQTGLEWIAGPNQDTNYTQAVKWVSTCDVRGGGWRMPTYQELSTLYQKGSGKRNMDTLFQMTGWWVWAEEKDAKTAWFFDFDGCYATANWREDYYLGRVFGVRSRP